MGYIEAWDDEYSQLEDINSKIFSLGEDTNFGKILELRYLELNNFKGISDSKTRQEYRTRASKVITKFRRDKKNKGQDISKFSLGFNNRDLIDPKMLKKGV